LFGSGTAAVFVRVWRLRGSKKHEGSAVAAEPTKKDAGRQRELEKKLAVDINLQLKSGRTYNWRVLQAAELFRHYCNTNETYRGFVRYALQQAVNAPLTLILYEDEITPGNVFMVRRKVHAWYFSFREFNLHLRNEQAWICFAVLQSTIPPIVKAEFSAVSKELLLTMFSENRQNFSSFVVVELPEARCISVKLEDLQDAEAKRAKWAIMGASGLRPCMHCTTVFMKGHPASSAREDFHDMTELNWADVEKNQATDQDLWDAQDQLIQLSAAGKSVKKLETILGMHCCPEGLLACKPLRRWAKPSESKYDPMHCYFSDGIAEKETGLILKELARLGFDLNQLQQLCNSGWKPKETLLLRESGIKGGASEELRAVPLLRHYLVKLVKPSALGELADKIKSYERLADVVEYMQALKLLSKVPASAEDKLRRLQSLHYEAYKAAWGTTNCIPKHHFSMHLPPQLDGLFIDTFVCERKHRLVKEVAHHYRQSKSMNALELHMVSRVNLLQLDEMRADEEEPFSANTAKTPFGLTVHAGDVFFAGSNCYELRECVRDARGLSLIAKRFTFIGNDAHRSAKRWRDSGESVTFSVQAAYTCSAPNLRFGSFLALQQQGGSRRTTQKGSQVGPGGVKKNRM